MESNNNRRRSSRRAVINAREMLELNPRENEEDEELSEILNEGNNGPE